MRSSLRCASVLVLSVAVAISRAHALDLCGPLANLIPYGVLATDKYDASLGYNVFSVCYFGPAIDEGSVCSTTSRFVGGPIVGYGDVVALASTGVAIANPRSGPGVYCGESRVVNAVTGGGSVSGTIEVVTGVIDTSGSHPALSPCAQAMADAATVSAALATLPAPPAQTLDRVVVKKDDVVTLDAGTGGVINIKTLKLASGHLTRGQGQEHGCDEGPTLYLTTDPSYVGDVVINVQNLFIGQCTYMDLSYGTARNVVFNVPGTGRAVRIGVAAEASFVQLLAPQRDVTIAGDANSDTPTYHSSVWAKRVKSKAFTYIRYGDKLLCP